MEKKKTDRRVRFTKNLLRDALVELMQTQHISAISVTAICEIADINRSTFYAHNTDPADLLSHLEQEVLENLRHYLAKQDYSDNIPINEQELTKILEYLKENADLFKALLSKNCDFAVQQRIVELSEAVHVTINPKYSPEVQEYLSVYGITGCISIVQKWLHSGMNETPAEISQFLLQVLYNGMFSFL